MIRLGIVLVLVRVAFSAEPFTIQNRNYGNVPASVQSEVDALFDSVEADVNKSLPDADQSTYLKGMSNAGVISVKGIGVDYTGFDIAALGAGLGVGADLGDNSFSDLVGGDIDGSQVRGFGAQVAIMAGINLGVFNFPEYDIIDLNRMKVFVSFMSLDIPKFEDGLSGEVSNFGLHVQYELMEEIDLAIGLVKWGGISITTGIQTSSLNITFNKAFNVSKSQEINVSPVTATATAAFTGTAVAGADVSLWSIPIEASTSIRLLYALGLYGGLAGDLNGGEAKSLASLTGDVAVSENSGTNVLGDISATAALDLGQSDGPTSFNMRWFAGLEINAVILKLFVQFQHGIGEGTYAANVGTRLAW